MVNLVRLYAGKGNLTYVDLDAVQPSEILYNGEGQITVYWIANNGLANKSYTLVHPSYVKEYTEESLLKFYDLLIEEWRNNETSVNRNCSSDDTDSTTS